MGLLDGRNVGHASHGGADPYGDYLIYDTFTDIDGTDLESHTPEKDTVGGGWSTRTYYGDGPQIVGNVVLDEIGEESWSSIDTGVNANIAVQVDLKVPSTAHADFHINRVCLNAADELYLFGDLIQINFNAAGLALQLIAGGLEVASAVDPFVWADGATHTVRLELDATNTLAFFMDDVLYLSADQGVHAEAGTFAGWCQRFNYNDTSTADNFWVRGI